MIDHIVNHRALYHFSFWTFQRKFQATCAGWGKSGFADGVNERHKQHFWGADSSYRFMDVMSTVARGQVWHFVPNN
jgi:hypothetical protein